MVCTLHSEHKKVAHVNSYKQQKLISSLQLDLSKMSCDISDKSNRGDWMNNDGMRWCTNVPLCDSLTMPLKYWTITKVQPFIIASHSCCVGHYNQCDDHFNLVFDFLQSTKILIVCFNLRQQLSCQNIIP